MQLEVLTYKFENTNKCEVDKALNGYEAFQNVMVKFNENPP